MTDLNMGTQNNINFERLNYELMTALPDKLNGITQDKFKTLLVHVKDSEDAESLRATVLSVLAAHDPQALSPQQAQAQKALDALAELGASDYRAWRAGVENITTLNQAKTRLSQLGRVVWLLLQAQGISEMP